MPARVPQDRVKWADAARGLAIALVVLHHAAQRSVWAGGNEHWLWATRMLQTVRMPLFFLVAGIFARKWLVERCYCRLLETKVLLLGWVFVLWVLIRYFWFLPQPSRDKETPPLPDLLVRLLSPEGGWFIYTLALVFVIGNLAKGASSSWQLLITAVASLLWTSGATETGNKAWDGVGAYSFFFLAGAHLRELLLRAAAWLAGWRGWVVIATWAVGYVLLETVGMTTWLGFSFALRLVGVGAGIALAVALQRHNSLRCLGQRTLPVYMAHQVLVISGISALAAVHPLRGNSVWATTVPVLITVPVLLGTYHFGRVAPTIGLGWLFDTPPWLRDLVATKPRRSAPRGRRRCALAYTDRE